MKTIADFAMDILSRSPTPALPLSRLVEAIREETPGHVTGAERILTEIRSRPDLFRVLDPLIGPWRRATARQGESPPWSPETSVLYLASGTRASSPVGARTAESLRCLGSRVDENSATAVSRWLLLIERSVSKHHSTCGVNHPERHSPSSSTSSSPNARSAADRDTPIHSSSVIPLKINHPPDLSAPAKPSKSGTRTPA